MKVIVGIFLFFTLFLGVVFGVLFTQPGNDLLKPIIESKINKSSPLEAKISKFSLRMSNIIFALEFERDSKIFFQGDYSLFSKSIDAIFEVDMSDLSILNELTKQRLQGAFFIKGTIKGDQKSLKVEAASNVAGSKTVIDAELIEFKPSKIVASMSGAKISEILYMLSKPKFASGVINLDAKIDEIKKESIIGDVALNLLQGSLSTRVFQDEFNITLPETTFQSTTTAQLQGDLVKHNFLFESNLARLFSAGSSNIKTQIIDATYVVDVKELAMFKPITKQQFNGKFFTQGEIKGTKKSIEIVGNSDIAHSETSYLVTLEGVENRRVNVAANIKNAKLAELLYMVNQPKYANAMLNLDAKILDATSQKINGTLSFKADQGEIDTKVLGRERNITLAEGLNTFDINSLVKIEDSVAYANSYVNSKIATLKVEETIFDINSAHLSSNFEAEIPKLDNLYFVTKRHLNGGIKLVGDLKKDENLELNAYSDIFGGKFEAKLYNDELKQRFERIRLAELLHTMTYPKFFDSEIDSNLTYNLLTKKGLLEAALENGRFAKSNMTSIVLSTTGFDLTNEVYRNSTLRSDINDKIIRSDFFLKSDLTELTSNDALFDANRSYVDATIAMQIADDSIKVKLQGDAKSPKTSIDAGAMIKKAVDRNINELDKVLPKDAQEPVKSIIKGLFGN